MAAKRRTPRVDLARDAQYAMHAVVRVHVRGYNEVDIKSILDPRYAVPEEWVAAGFFIQLDGSEGYILTNSHVARNAIQIQIRSILTSEELFSAQVVGLVENLEPDIALLKLPPAEVERFKKVSGRRTLPFLKLADSQKIRRGAELKAIGYPMGMEEPNISGGEISNFISGDPYTIERLVTDASINPGNSGGPSIIAGGKVIGINTAIIVEATNIGFITPINYACHSLHQLIRNKKADLANLGADIQNNSSHNMALFKMKEPKGVIIKKVYPKGFCADAGLKRGDVIIEMNGFKFDRHGAILGENVFHNRNIYDVIHSVAIGDKVDITFVRNGSTVKRQGEACYSAPVQIASQPILKNRKFIFFRGLVIQQICREIVSALDGAMLRSEIDLYRDHVTSRSRIVITHIDPGSEAEEMGIYAGDVITKVNQHPVKTLRGIIQRVNSMTEPSSHSKRKNGHDIERRSILIETETGSVANFKSHSSSEIISITRFGTPNISK